VRHPYCTGRSLSSWEIKYLDHLEALPTGISTLFRPLKLYLLMEHFLILGKVYLIIFAPIFIFVVFFFPYGLNEALE
jgi:hypothetical protein